VRILLTDFLLRIVSRYGMLLVLIALGIAALLVLRASSKLNSRSPLSGVLAIGLLPCLLVAMAFVAPAALRSSVRLLQVMRAAFAVQAPISGPFAVASATVELAANSTSEQHEGAPLLVHLWYPADADGPARSATAGAVSCAQLHQSVTLPQTDAPVPLVLFAPGLGGTAAQMSLLTGALAARGYFVAAIDDLIRDPASENASPADEDIRLRPFDFSSAEALTLTMQRSSIRAEREARKALTALDRLEACLQKSTVLRDRIEFQRVGFVGYSFGGAAAAEASFLDSRIAAVVNLDGSQFGRAADGPVKVPYMLLRSDFDPEVLSDPNSPHRYEFMLDQRDLRLASHQSEQPGSHIFVIKGSFHDSFADPSLSARSLIKWLALDPYRAHDIVAAYVVGFLDAYLKDDHSSLIGPTDARYPEVRTLSSQG
jgi:predicted dienelactone hydrolase